MRTLPPRSSAFSFALVLFATLVVFPVAFGNFATAQSFGCTPCSVDFGSVQVGASQSAAVTLKNNGSAALKISNKEKDGPWAFSLKGITVPYTLGAGQSVALNLVYAPRVLRPQSATFTFITSTNSTVTISASGTGIRGGGSGGGGSLSASPTSLSFGSVPVGSTVTKPVTVSNPSRSSIAISQISLSSSASANPFSISGLTAPLTLSAGQSVTFSASYRPTTTSSSAGAISIVADNGSRISISESGVGTSTSTGQLALSPGSVNFGNVTVGATATKNLTLSASGAKMTVTAGSLTSSEFTVSGISLPLTLAAGQSVPVTVTFQPQSSGTASGNLTFTSSSTGSSSVSAGASLTGSGVAAPQHSVALNWRPSSSSVVGYNIYRGNRSGGPYTMLSTAPNATTVYTDTGVQGGSTYYYVVTSVDGSGQESVFSNQVQASIPTP